jgi:hypothetical protein
MNHKISPITRYLPLLTNMSPIEILSKNASFQREHKTERQVAGSDAEEFAEATNKCGSGQCGFP